jgi:hypothetical protein
MSVNCPAQAYVGESFFCRVTIQNSENASHSYKLHWNVDNSINDTFTSSGTIGPNETINTGLSLTFSDARDPYESYYYTGSYDLNVHAVHMALTQDGRTVASEDHRVDVVDSEISMVPTINPTPVFPNRSLSMNLAVVNEGKGNINATIYMSDVPQIQLQSSPIAHLNQINPVVPKNQTFIFTTAFDAGPGTYQVKVKVVYSDARDKLHTREYFVPVVVSSGETENELYLLELKEESDVNSIKSSLDLAYRFFIIIGAVLLAINISLASANYWYSRRTARSRRKTIT